jgi:mxaJ protein
MSFRSPESGRRQALMAGIAIAGILAVVGVRDPNGNEAVLRVCADPNNLPFSNDARQGFENKLATLIGNELGRPLRFTWFAQRRGFVRETLNAGTCDFIPGVPTSFERTLNTRPYYRSTYVFVTRVSDTLDLASLDDPRLRSLRIGVHLVGDDGANTPPVHALSTRGIVGNLRGYMLSPDYAAENPPARLIEAVANGDVDVAIAWGPMAAYFAKRQRVPLRIERVTPEIDLPFLPMVYDISVGVRRGDTALWAAINSVIERRQDDIDRLLATYGVPLVRQHRVTARASAGAR